MTLCKKRSSTDQKKPLGIAGEPYLLINTILAGVILLIMAYSGFFSPVKDNYPVACIHEQVTGEPCASCGLSHSFSLILRGRLGEALNWNIYGLRVFLFFVLQLLMRVVFSFLWVKNVGIRKQIVIYDIAASIMIFLISFWPFIYFIFSQLKQVIA